MEKQQLPNSTAILVLGILSIIGCCCYGILGLILGVVTLIMAKKATAIYLEQPENYSGFQNVKTGKILAYIGLALSIIYVIITIASLIMYGGFEGLQEMQQNMLEQYGNDY